MKHFAKIIYIAIIAASLAFIYLMYSILSFSYLKQDFRARMDIIENLSKSTENYGKIHYQDGTIIDMDIFEFNSMLAYLNQVHKPASKVNDKTADLIFENEGYEIKLFKIDEEKSIMNAVLNKLEYNFIIKANALWFHYENLNKQIKKAD